MGTSRASRDVIYKALNKGQHVAGPTSKTRTIKIGPYSRTVTKNYDPMNYDKTSRMAGVVYGKGNQKIKKSKIVTVQTPRKTTKTTISYSPVGYYGKQSKQVYREITRH